MLPKLVLKLTIVSDEEDDNLETRQEDTPLSDGQQDQVTELLDKYKDTIEDDYHFVKMKFDLCNGNKSPFNNINFYNKDTVVDSKNIEIQKLIPVDFNETIISVYKK